jgi:DNA polymerase-3 subunit beta
VEFELERDAFAEAIAWTAKGLPTRPVVPVTAGVVLEVTDGAMIVSGFDFEVLNRIEVPVTEKAPGRVLVSGRLLAEIARALPPKDVRVTVEGNRLAVRCGSARFNLPLLHIEDYPAVPELPATSGRARGDVFATAVGQVTAAASRDETLPMLTGVRMEIGPDTLSLAATDRYRLAERHIHGRRPARCLPARSSFPPRRWPTWPSHSAQRAKWCCPWVPQMTPVSSVSRRAVGRR